MRFDDAYLAHQQARNKATATVYEARRALRLWREFLRERPETFAEAEAFVAWRLSQASPSTTNKDIRFLKAAYNWAAKRRFAPNVFADVEKIAEDAKIVRPLPLDVVERLIEHAWKQDRQFAGLPLLGFFAALRISEAIGQRAQDVSPTGDRVFVVKHEHLHLKSRAERVMGVSERAQARLRELREKAGDGFIVGWGHKPISRSHAYRMYAGWSKAIGHDVHPHDLRRTCLSTLAEKGAAPAKLQTFAGHASVQTTMRHYVGVKGSDIGALL